jgi:tRNA-splicing ligase RtcB
MNVKQLIAAGVPPLYAQDALVQVLAAIRDHSLHGKGVKEGVRTVAANPGSFVDDPVWSGLARCLTAEAMDEAGRDVNLEPIDYAEWGSMIDKASREQMRNACRLPMARGAALMPDAHVGYGLPIGGVLGLENAVIPYGVGVDIACRMKLSVIDMPADQLERRKEDLKNAILRGTVFGVGGRHAKPLDHAVMDEDWNVCRVTRENKDKAWTQLGTSGSGNHFVEWGTLTIAEAGNALGLEPGEYLALMSHSGSRGVGASVCNHYSRLARQSLPKKYEFVGDLAWLDLDKEAGQEYWAAMNLMGEYAAANHALIHKLVTNLLGARIIAGVENHHNFAWKEQHEGRELIVHRKGATPAGEGVLGVIPGSMGSPAYVVAGKGNPASLASASHGAGRLMSRGEAKRTFSFVAERRELAARGITVLSAGADEVPGVYKDIEKVMAEQADLVHIVARFDPKIVKMSEDGKAED